MDNVYFLHAPDSVKEHVVHLNWTERFTQTHPAQLRSLMMMVDYPSWMNNILRNTQPVLTGLLFHFRHVMASQTFTIVQNILKVYRRLYNVWEMFWWNVRPNNRDLKLDMKTTTTPSQDRLTDCVFSSLSFVWWDLNLAHCWLLWQHSRSADGHSGSISGLGGTFLTSIVTHRMQMWKLSPLGTQCWSGI